MNYNKISLKNAVIDIQFYRKCIKEAYMTNKGTYVVNFEVKIKEVLEKYKFERKFVQPSSWSHSHIFAISEKYVVCSSYRDSRVHIRLIPRDDYEGDFDHTKSKDLFVKLIESVVANTKCKIIDIKENI